ncbi:hypothetical protein Pcinc_026985 [Petrolisthes cinctipes]|uniref:Uncharacterized protein n=1 Tax=Petrolisthes cinctipes TaxID=88211 RepID=A0AAE1F4W5_PETCI|nr:hypothetical protein Pcinc_026985 [Petrolisthes cinctipes]
MNGRYRNSLYFKNVTVTLPVPARFTQPTSPASFLAQSRNSGNRIEPVPSSLTGSGLAEVRFVLFLKGALLSLRNSLRYEYTSHGACGDVKEIV